MQEKPKRYQCRHIFTDGHRCGSPCLRHEELCYYHHTTRRPIDDPAQRRGRQAQFDLPLPEDRGAIQCAIGEVILRIARNQIDPKRAGLLLYGLQIASINLPRKADRDRDSFPVEEVTTDPQLGTLAPRIEVGKATIPEERLSVVARLLRDTAPLLDDEAGAPRPASGTWDSTKTSTEPAITDAPTPALEHPAEAPQDQTTELLLTLHASEAPADDGKQHQMLVILSAAKNPRILPLFLLCRCLSSASIDSENALATFRKRCSQYLRMLMVRSSWPASQLLQKSSSRLLNSSVPATPSLRQLISFANEDSTRGEIRNSVVPEVVDPPS